MSVRRWPARVVLLAALAGAACTSYASVRFTPPIQDVELRDGEAPQARMIVSWRGIAERDGVPELRFRVRVDVLGAEAFTFSAQDFELMDGALTSFGPARAETLPLTIAPGASATFDLAFPPAEGKRLREHDLSALDLRTRFQDGRWNSNTPFQRAELYPYYYDPYWYPPWYFHFGLVCHP